MCGRMLTGKGRRPRGQPPLRGSHLPGTFAADSFRTCHGLPGGCHFSSLALAEDL